MIPGDPARDPVETLPPVEVRAVQAGFPFPHQVAHHGQRHHQPKAAAICLPFEPPQGVPAAPAVRDHGLPCPERAHIVVVHVLETVEHEVPVVVDALVVDLQLAEVPVDRPGIDEDGVPGQRHRIWRGRIIL